MGVKVHAASEILKHLTGVVNADAQVSDRCVALTVGAIYKQEAPGQLDLDGSAFVEGERSPLATDGDWWLLDPGDYLLRFNEALEVGRGMVALVSPHPGALVNGIAHPTLALGPGEPLGIVPLRVGGRGARVARSARISTVLLLD